MTPKELRDFCLSLPGAWPDVPWEGDAVAKVGERIFAFPGETSVTLKCGRTRAEADEWVVRYPDEAKPAAYVGRFGWNELTFTGAIPDAEILEAVRDSYDAIVAVLPKRQRPV